jgi:predicted NUDIX family phosphoesterase
MTKRHPEKILCISEETLFEKEKWNGLKDDDLEYYKDLVVKNGEFRPRDDLEEDSSYKQVITQVALRYNGKYFLHKMVNRNEERLNGLCPLFLGGHIEEFDLKKDGSTIEEALMREVNEEVELNAKILKKEFKGLIYIEDENPVNWVHVGMVYVFDIDSEDVHIKEEGLEDIGFVSLDYLKTNPEKLNYWSRVLIYHL